MSMQRGFMRGGPMDGPPPGTGRPFPAGMPPNPGPPLQFEFGRVADSSKLKERGFAFITPEDGSENLFYHIHWWVIEH
jgi:hypothetical protein